MTVLVIDKEGCLSTCHLLNPLSLAIVGVFAHRYAVIQSPYQTVVLIVDEALFAHGRGVAIRIISEADWIWPDDLAQFVGPAKVGVGIRLAAGNLAKAITNLVIGIGEGTVRHRWRLSAGADCHK